MVSAGVTGSLLISFWMTGHSTKPDSRVKRWVKVIGQSENSDVSESRGVGESEGFVRYCSRRVAPLVKRRVRSLGEVSVGRIGSLI